MIYFEFYKTLQLFLNYDSIDEKSKLVLVKTMKKLNVDFEEGYELVNKDDTLSGWFEIVVDNWNFHVFKNMLNFLADTEKSGLY